MSRPAQPCWACGQPRDGADLENLACHGARKIGGQRVPLCPDCFDLKPRTHATLAVLERLIEENVDGLGGLSQKARDEWDREERPPARSTLSGAAAYLGLVSEANAWVVDGTRGGYSLVVTTLEGTQVLHHRRRTRKNTMRLDAWPAPRHRLEDVMSQAPADLRARYLDRRGAIA